LKKDENCTSENGMKFGLRRIIKEQVEKIHDKILTAKIMVVVARKM